MQVVIGLRLAMLAAVGAFALTSLSNDGAATALAQESAAAPLEAFAKSYADAWSSQDPESVAALFDEDGRLTVNSGEPAIGRDAIADVARSFMEALPDMVVQFDRLGRSGDRVLFHWTLAGTNTGPGGAGASIRISGTEAWLLGESGLIADSIGSFDAADYERQLAAPLRDALSDANRLSGPPQIDADRQDIQETIDTVYASISGPLNAPRDWDAFRSVFTDDARLFAITPQGLRGGSVEDYISASDESLVDFGFREQELVNHIEVYGNLAQVWSSYEGDFVRDGEPGRIRGINSFQLRRLADGSWRIHSLLWQQETPAFPLPVEMAGESHQPRKPPVHGNDGEPHSHIDTVSSDALVAAPEHHILLLENDRVRVLETCVGPGELTNIHSHGWPAVQYVVSWSDFVRRDPAGEVVADSRDWEQHPSPGQALWSGPSEFHSIENVGSTNLCVIAVELKDDGSEPDLTPILENRTRVILDGIRSGDVSEIMALYGSGSVYSTDNATLLSDPEAIEAFWVDVAASPAHDATLEVLRIERLGPDAFVEIQKYDVFDEAGERLFGGYASLLWRRVDGRWIIAADVSN